MDCMGSHVVSKQFHSPPRAISQPFCLREYWSSGCRMVAAPFRQPFLSELSRLARCTCLFDDVLILIIITAKFTFAMMVFSTALCFPSDSFKGMGEKGNAKPGLFCPQQTWHWKWYICSSAPTPMKFLGSVLLVAVSSISWWPHLDFGDSWARFL